MIARSLALLASIGIASALAAATRAGTPAARWTRLRSKSSASCEVLARAASSPDLPYPYFTTYVLRKDIRVGARVSCPTKRESARAIPRESGCGGPPR